MRQRQRLKIPKAVEHEVLFRSAHTCCICHDRNKDVQIHHVDGNPNNNRIENLAVLCLDCHSRVSGPRGLGKAYSPEEARKYKSSWEARLRESRRVQRPVIRYQKELISQIDLLVCDVLASDKDVGRARRLLNIMYELHLWRGNREIERRLIDGLHHLATMTGLSKSSVAPLVADKIWDFCWQYAGPRDVPMSQADQRDVLACIRALSTLTEFNCFSGHSRRTVESAVDAAEEFFQLGLRYRRRQILDAVIWMYRALKGCGDFKYGATRLRRSLRYLGKLLDDQGKDRSLHRRAINRLLASAN